MPYEQEISRANPALVMFVLDQSGSMNDGSAGTPRRKTEVLSTAVNRFIRELTLECSKGEAKPRHYFDVSLIGYCTDSTGAQSLVGSAFQGELAGRDVASVVDLFDHVLRIETKEVDDGDGGLMKKRSYIWYDPMAQYGTPMHAALAYARTVAAGWIAAHPTSFPPLVLHITDGEPSDATPEMVEQQADALRQLSTEDGDLLLFNCHLSERADPPLLFPAFEFDIPGDDSRRLFRMSSELPERCLRMAREKGYQVDANARGMMFNADSTCLIKLIQIGTRFASGNVNPLK